MKVTYNVIEKLEKESVSYRFHQKQFEVMVVSETKCTQKKVNIVKRTLNKLKTLNLKSITIKLN